MSLLSFILVIVCGILERKQIYSGLLSFVIYVLPLGIQLSRGRVRIPLTDLIPQHFCECFKPEPDIPTSYVVFFLCLQFAQLRWEVIVCFVDIGEIEVHYCLTFLFIIILKSNNNTSMIVLAYYIYLYNTFLYFLLKFHWLLEIFRTYIHRK